MKCHFPIAVVVGVLFLWTVPSNGSGDDKPYDVILTDAEVLTVNEKLIDKKNTYAEPTGESIIISLHWLQDIMGTDTAVTYTLESKSDAGFWNPFPTVVMNPFTQQQSKAECFIKMFNNFKGEDESDGVLDLLGGEEGWNKKGQTWISNDMEINYDCLPEHIRAASEFRVLVKIIKNKGEIFTAKVQGLIQQK